MIKLMLFLLTFSPVQKTDVSDVTGCVGVVTEYNLYKFLCGGCTLFVFQRNGLSFTYLGAENLCKDLEGGDGAPRYDDTIPPPLNEKGGLPGTDCDPGVWCMDPLSVE